MGSIAGAAIGAGANVINTNKTNQANIQMTNATNQANRDIANATNQANKDIAQMNNEYNQRMLTQQIQNQWQMWNAENEYNSPEAQMQRYQDAGVNPYMAMGNVSSGNASSMTAPSAAPADASGLQQMGAPMQAGRSMPTDFSPLSALNGLVSEFTQAMSFKSDLEGKILDNQGKQIENDYKADMFKVQMYKAMADANLSKSQKRGLDIENMFKPEMLSSELNLRKTQEMYTRMQTAGQAIANMQQYQWLKALPQQIQNTLNEQVARIAALKAQKNLTDAQVRTEVHKSFKEYYDALGAKGNVQLQTQQYEFNEQMNPKMLRKMEADVERAILDAQPKTWREELSTRPDGFGKKFIGVIGNTIDTLSPFKF